LDGSALLLRIRFDRANLDGSPESASVDFVTQGVGHLASGLVHKLPVHSTLSSTEVGVLAGARHRIRRRRFVQGVTSILQRVAWYHPAG
jgi:hypothetical protein